MRTASTAVYTASGSGDMWTKPPMDLARAQECASAFGECSVEELYELKTGNIIALSTHFENEPYFSLTLT